MSRIRLAVFGIVLSLCVAPAARAGLTVKAAALGDSLVDEYQFADDPTDRQAAKNFVEILAETGRLDFGAFSTATRGEPRRQGYARNWALSGARTHQLAPQVAGLAGQAAAGDARVAVLMIGGDDFRDVVAGADPATTVARGVANTVGAAQALLASNPNLRLVVGTVPDITKVPEARTAVQLDPTLAPVLAQLSQLIDQYNAALAGQIAGNPRVTLIDLNGVFKKILSQPSSAVSGVTLNTTVPSADPTHLFVDDLHPGTVGQALIANGVIDAIDMKFGYDVPRLSDAEIRAEAGIRTGAVPLPPAVWAAATMLPLAVWGARRLRVRPE
jgi:lysophospholipase L1-like esterase